MTCNESKEEEDVGLGVGRLALDRLAMYGAWYMVHGIWYMVYGAWLRFSVDESLKVLFFFFFTLKPGVE